MNEPHFWDSIFQQDFETVTLFLDNNPDFDINLINSETNTTPLICAIDSDSVEMVELILKKGANPNIAGNGMSLALNHTIELAIEADDYRPGDYLDLLEMLKLLLLYGANPHLENFNGKTAYEYAQIQFSPAKELFDHHIHKSMILFNGWISVRIAEESDITEKELIPQLELIFQKVKKYNPFCEIIKPGGNIQLQIAGAHNHDNGYSTDLKELLEKIVPIAPESYGLIYVRWPEHEQLWNQFKVYKLAQGKVIIEDDIYLSPCNPVIENPF